MVFNPTLKTCDTPNNFPCRVIEGSEPSALETGPEVSPDHRQGEQSTPGNATGSSTSGINSALRGTHNPVECNSLTKPMQHPFRISRNF